MLREGAVGTILDDRVHERYFVDGDVNGDGVVGRWLRRVTDWEIKRKGKDRC